MRVVSMKLSRFSNSQSFARLTTNRFLIPSICRLSLIPSSHIHSTPLPSLPLVAQSPIDLLSTLLANQLAYEATERDMVVLHHELGTTNTEGQKELFISTMVQYGIPGGHSAMAKTVGMVSFLIPSLLTP